MAIVSFKSQLIALFNAKNTGLAQALAEADVDFGELDLLVGDETGRNTKLTITAKAASEHFTGALELHYTRPSPDVVGSKAHTADLADWDTDEEVLAIVNADVIAAGKTEDAFTLDELNIQRSGTGTNEDPQVIVVNIKNGHIKYQGGPMATYTITEEIKKTDLSTTNGELDGFTA